jgi:SDR family mycofactocin-dependent oxidoreductase
MGRVDGKVALITGAARGMGASHAKVLAREGADVVLLDAPANVTTTDYALSTKEDLDRTAAAVEEHDRRAIVVEGDVRAQADLDGAVERALSEFGRLDYLVANAGIWGQLAPITEMTDDQWQETVDINLTGEWRAIKAVAPHMIERQQGAIVCIASISALEGQPNSANYSSAKHGVIGLMRSAALELGPHNIRCNAICPGFIDTPIHHWQAAYDMMAGHPGGTAQDRQNAARYYGILRGRGPLDPAHVSNAVLFLLSDEAAEITGISVPVDSGHTVLPPFNPAPVDA